MFRFFIFSAIVVGLIYQPLPTEASAKDEAKNAFHKLMEVIDQALTDAQDALNKAVDSVKAKATELKNKAKVELDKILAPLRKKLDDLVAKAKKIGFDVSKCQRYVDAFSKIAETLVHNMFDCVNEQLTKAQNLVNDALNNAKQIEQDLNSIDADIDKCDGNVWKQFKCYAKIIEKIAKVTEEAPQHIIEDVAKTTALISNILPIMEDCELNQLKKAGEDAAKDVIEFGICAAL